MATIGNLKIGAGSLDGGALYAFFVAADGGRIGKVIERFGMRLLTQLLEHEHDVHPAACAKHGIQAGNTGSNFGPQMLWQAAGSDQQLAGAFGGGELIEHGEGFVTRRADEAASVDDEYIGFLGGWAGLISGTRQQFRHGVRIDRVLGATQGDDVKAQIGQVSRSGFRWE